MLIQYNVYIYILCMNSIKRHRNISDWHLAFNFATTNKDIIGNTDTCQFVYTVIHSLLEAKTMFSVEHTKTVYISINKGFRNTTSIINVK